MDLVGLLPKYARGHKFILGIMDYVTRHPKVVPHKTTSNHHTLAGSPLQQSGHSWRDLDGPRLLFYLLARAGCYKCNLQISEPPFTIWRLMVWWSALIKPWSTWSSSTQRATTGTYSSRTCFSPALKCPRRCGKRSCPCTALWNRSKHTIRQLSRANSSLGIRSFSSSQGTPANSWPTDRDPTSSWSKWEPWACSSLVSKQKLHNILAMYWNCHSERR